MVSISVPCPKISLVARAGSTRDHPQQMRMISLPSPSLSSGFLCPRKKQSALWKVHAKVNEVIAEKPSNCARVVDTESSNGKVGSAESNIPDASSISAFMTQVSEIVKLVDSRDIMELQMKQMDCEIIIRKREALQQPAFAMPPSMPHAMYTSPPGAAPAPAPASAAPPALTAPAKTSQSSHPPLKCPMAGTFYRCPGPGEPPFIKVGDKVQKGQVICIIEAMKLMNEIEADQSGTVTEILAEDGKPVSVDMPLLVIAP
ncbi:hypothetical protein EZV62_015747 [Acer yangbiense]|uniref:Biotin carboxyl carrier protein of acetyl-CoA carboxylase n=1 Tax=Acer yangbiense TaxID=1000413 RepID=A0A5C7HM27_9ROSI|nr:hypothetical protein EZV62_015747 [Acer yangbiense]